MAGRIFWAFVAGFLLGVFARSFFPFGLSFAAMLALVGVCCAMLALIDTSSARATLVVSAALISGAFGIARMNSATLTGDPTLSAHLGQHATLEGTVVAEPDVREGSVRLSVAANSLVLKNATSTVRANILAALPAHAPVSYGDAVVISGILQAPESFDTGLGRQFDYPDYLAEQGITYQLSSAYLDDVAPRTGDPLQAAAIAAKQTFVGGLDATLPEPEAGFAGGITVGDKRSIGPELTADFQRVSLIHMVVLSGYNITVVLDAAAWAVAHTPLLNSLRFAPLGISGFIVLLFILMSGGASSAARAGVMALIAVFAHTSRRTFFASRALGAAALVIVAWNPFTLAFDPSFQLSALATAGLIVFSPLFAAILPWMPERWALREIASSTLGTQLAVLPLLLYQNGQLSPYALPANLLTLPLVPMAMLFSAVASGFGILFGSLATIVALPAYLILSYIIFMAQFLAGLPYAGIAVPAFGAWWLALAYAVLFIGAWRLRRMQK